jgi:hypothetical protein
LKVRKSVEKDRKLVTKAGTYFAKNDFRSEVLGGSTQGPRPALHPLGKPEICDLKLPVNSVLKTQHNNKKMVHEALTTI